MKLPILVVAATLFPGTLASPAVGGSLRARAPADAIVVCQRAHRHCWLEPGSQHRFYHLFGGARGLTETGVLGVWRPVRLFRRHRRAR
jgi:hypothetical protein